MSNTTRFFAVIPAAGTSTRMGRHKLLLPWGDRTVIEHVIDEWISSRVCNVVIVVRSDDAALREVLSSYSDAIDVVVADPPPSDMKESFALGLRHAEATHDAADSDYCFVAPADLPGLNQHVIDRMINAASTSETDAALLPMFGNKQRHPVLLRLSATKRIPRLPANVGLDRLIDDLSPVTVEFPSDQYTRDIDTPEDYVRATKQHNHHESFSRLGKSK